MATTMPIQLADRRRLDRLEAASTLQGNDSLPFRIDVFPKKEKKKTKNNTHIGCSDG